jgi:hypothetical protein
MVSPYKMRLKTMPGNHIQKWHLQITSPKNQKPLNEIGIPIYIYLLDTFSGKSQEKITVFCTFCMKNSPQVLQLLSTEL